MVVGEILICFWNNLKVGGRIGIEFIINFVGGIVDIWISIIGFYVDNLNVLIFILEF